MSTCPEACMCHNCLPGSAPPTLPPGTCGHAVPAFGCETCIGRDKQNVLLAAIGTTQAPPCPECDRPMRYEEASPEAMVLYFGCTAGTDKEGDSICDGVVAVKVSR